MPKVPDFLILYTREGVDITEDLRPDLSALEFTDNLEGESDELRIGLDNVDGKWFAEWLPDEGDIITASLGYKDQPLLGPIDFEIDKVSWRGMPDTFEIGALASPITKAMRETNHKAYENTTLRAIAQQIASKYDLELKGEIPNIRFERITNKGKRDLEFLRDLAEDYGCIFKIDSLKFLVFFREEDLETQESSFTVSTVPTEGALAMSGYSLSRENAGTYKQANISYQDSAKKFVDVTINLDGKEVPKPKESEEGTIASDDELRIQERVESLAVAKIRAVAALKRANQSRVKASISTEGNTAINAGITYNLEGVGRLSGKYLITKVSHSIRKAYTTSFESRKINDPT
jgi:phage protein D